VEKQEKRPLNHSGVPSDDAFMLSLVKKSGLSTFGVNNIANLCRWDRHRINNTLDSLLMKKAVTRVGRGRFTLTESIAENIFQISTELIKPSYISFRTALSHYGFTEKTEKKVQLVSTRKIGKMTIGDFKTDTITLKPSRFFGHVWEEGFLIAEPEKALIDTLFRPDQCGGLDGFAKCLENAWSELEESKLFHYAIGFDDRSLISRLGHIIEVLELETRNMGMLLSNRSKSYVTLDPAERRSGEYDKVWRVIINHKIDKQRIRSSQ
jgi:predicted transcriptional regulator of viral defense system